MAGIFDSLGTVTCARIAEAATDETLLRMYVTGRDTTLVRRELIRRGADLDRINGAVERLLAGLAKEIPGRR